MKNEHIRNMFREKLFVSTACKINVVPLILYEIEREKTKK